MRDVAGQHLVVGTLGMIAIFILYPTVLFHELVKKKASQTYPVSSSFSFPCGNLWGNMSSGTMSDSLLSDCAAHSEVQGRECSVCILDSRADGSARCHAARRRSPCEFAC